jgi:hypothetical protein
VGNFGGFGGFGLYPRGECIVLGMGLFVVVLGRYVWM